MWVYEVWVGHAPSLYYIIRNNYLLELPNLNFKRYGLGEVKARERERESQRESEWKGEIEWGARSKKGTVSEKRKQPESDEEEKIIPVGNLLPNLGCGKPGMRDRLKMKENKLEMGQFVLFFFIWFCSWLICFCCFFFVVVVVVFLFFFFFLFPPLSKRKIFRIFEYRFRKAYTEKFQIR